MELFFAMIAWIFGILSGLYFKIGIVLFVLVLTIFVIIELLSRSNKKFKVKTLNLI